MDKEQILSSLKSSIGETSLRERTLSEYVDVNLPSDGTEPDEAYFARHAAVLKSVQGQYNRDLADAINKYKSENPVPAPTPAPAPSPAGGKDGGSAELAALQARLAKMEAEQNAHREAYRLDVMKRELVAKGDELKVSNKSLWEDVVSSSDLSGAADTAAALSVLKSSYEEKLKRYTSGVAPYGGRSGGGDNPSDAEMKRRSEAYKARLNAK